MRHYIRPTPDMSPARPDELSARDEVITLRLYLKHKTPDAALYSTQDFGRVDAADVWLPLSQIDIVRVEPPATPFTLVKHIVEVPIWLYDKRDELHSALEV